MINAFFGKIWRSTGMETALQRRFLYFAMLCSAMISCDYAIIRPVANSVFLSHYSSHILPYVWLAAIPLNAGIIWLYNRYLAVLGCWRLFCWMMAAIVVSNVFAAAFAAQVPAIAFFQFMWKETYVLLLFQALWSVIHASMTAKQAQALYGFLFGVGGLGALLGSLLPGFFAIHCGSEPLLYYSLPVIGLLFLSYYYLLKSSQTISQSTTLNRGGKAPSDLKTGFSLVMKSRLLFFILVIVVLMQFCSTLIDYQFNLFLQGEYPEKNLRTELMGQLGGIISIGTLFMQFFGVYLINRYFGLRGAHLIVPLIVGVNYILGIFIPTLSMLSYSFVAIKVLDFSLFGISKETLYAGMASSESFQAKAVIDVFAYRTAKAVVALLILMLQMTPWINMSVLSGIGFVLFVVWSAVVIFYFRKKETVNYKSP